jgi:hypothetical protein
MNLEILTATAAPGRGINLALSGATRSRRFRGRQHQEGASQMPKWNFVAMGQVGLTGWSRDAAQPVGCFIACGTGRPAAEILSLIGAAFLTVTLIDFLRNVDAVIAAG